MANPTKTTGEINFENQLDHWFPDRVKPDGWIGNTAHRGHTSSHNPDDTPGSKPEWNGDPDSIPEVRALDISPNLGYGITDGYVLVAHLLSLPGLAQVIRYIIWHDTIWHVNNKFKAAEYNGEYHTHVHITFAFTQAADNNTTFNYGFGEIPVRLTPEDIDAIADAVTSRLITPTPLKGSDGQPDGTQSTPVGHHVLSQGIPNPVAGGKRTPAYEVLSDILAIVKPAN